MVRKDVWFLVDKVFLSRVHVELEHLYRKLKESYKAPPEKTIRIMRSFTKSHPLNGSVDQFFTNYYRTNLIAKHKDDPSKVMMFGFLRTILLGILRNSPRTRVFTKRVRRYQETYRIAKSLEDFLSLYRRRVGFHKKTLSSIVFQEAGTQSECKDLPEYACLPPRCRFVQTVRNGRPISYCSRHESRRRKRHTRRKSRGHR
jgi:hypothetical protein